MGGTIYMERKIVRGDIYLANLSPVVGSEQGGVRPVLIISNNTGNKFSTTIIIAAITSRTKNFLPTHVAVDLFKELEKDSIVLLEQIRTIDKQRLENYIGLMPTFLMARVDKALAISISLKGSV
jgi:mRNA interferase MazF